MPDLKWDDIDLLEFFEVAPIVEEYGISHRYEVINKGLRLHFILWQWESAFEVGLYREGSEVSLLHFGSYVRGAIRYVDDGRGNYLEFNDCIIVPNRFSYLDAGNVFSHERFPFSITIILERKPDIRITLHPYNRKWDTTVD